MLLPAESCVLRVSLLTQRACVRFRLSSQVWSTRRQDSKLIDVCSANSVGFKETKSCINQYKKNPAVRTSHKPIFPVWHAIFLFTSLLLCTDGQWGWLNVSAAWIVCLCRVYMSNCSHFEHQL